MRVQEVSRQAVLFKKCCPFPLPPRSFALPKYNDNDNDTLREVRLTTVRGLASQARVKGS